MNNSFAEVRPELVPEWSEKNLDSAEIQQNFAGGVAPPDKVESEVDTT